MKKYLLPMVLVLSVLVHAADKKVEVKATVSIHAVNLSWNASVANCTAGLAYNVYRGNTAGGENYANPLNAAPQAGLTYTDNNVTALTQYFYTVKTYCGSSTVKESIASNEVNPTVPGDAQPTPPPNLTVSSVQ